MYEQSPGRNGSETWSVVDTILGNIGEPLRVDEDTSNEDSGESTEVVMKPQLGNRIHLDLGEE